MGSTHTHTAPIYGQHTRAHTHTHTHRAPVYGQQAHTHTHTHTHNLNDSPVYWKHEI